MTSAQKQTLELIASDHHVSSANCMPDNGDMVVETGFRFYVVDFYGNITREERI